ncbi:Potassium efflux system KefA protein / Small-conductance mechanosensitive channel [hydrothermal vent metagenome]|uniref:Potassium efflux system KefA protein / Small-conductance mechanosensitive channel n=1 Tax=hydrothermal vent metagenome TaxID=652676 RepID=A0A3B0W7Q1_9ZZZZ
MEIIEKILPLLEQWFHRFTTMQGGIQLITVIGCGALAAVTHKKWQLFITRLLGDFEKQNFFQFLLQGTNRIAFPMSMLLYLLITRFVIEQFDIDVTVLDIFTPLLLSMAAITLTIYVLRTGYSPSPALRAWEGFISMFIWGLVALHLIGWLPDLINALDGLAVSFGESRLSLLSILKLLAAVIFFVVMANWLTQLIESQALRSPHITPSMRVMLTKISKFSLYGLAVLFALKSVGIDLTAFAVFSGAIGVGIGFGLQKIFSNFISGFILLFDRSIRPGDVISIGDRFGWVQSLHARYVVVKDRDGVETLIPNENMITSEVTNWSYSDRAVRQRIPVQISYDNDPEAAMKLLLDAAIDKPRVLKSPEPAVRLIGFGDNGIDLELRIWINDPESGVANVVSEVNLSIWKSFKENNITIPFPQRDVRIISETPTIK